MFAFCSKASKPFKFINNAQLYRNCFHYSILSKLFPSNSILSKLFPSNSTVIQPKQQLKLNVGGVEYQTTLTTLTSKPNCLFTKLFNGEFPLAQDKQNAYCIKRNGEAFKYILDYLQNGGSLSGVQIPFDPATYDAIIKEANFYQLPSMASEVQEQYPIESNILSVEQRQMLIRFAGCQIELLASGSASSLPDEIVHNIHFVVIKLKTGHVFVMDERMFTSESGGIVWFAWRLLDNLDSPHASDDYTETDFDFGDDQHFFEINETDGTFKIAHPNCQHTVCVGAKWGVASCMLMDGAELRKLLKEEIWEKDEGILSRGIDTIEVFGYVQYYTRLSHRIFSKKQNFKNVQIW